MQARSVFLRLSRLSRYGFNHPHIRLVSSSVLGRRRVLLSCSTPPLLQRPQFQRSLPFQSRWVSSQVPLSDPSRPDLYYHFVSLPRPSDPSQSTPAYALSFLPTPPPSGRSPTIIGWLPAVSEGASEDVDAGLNDFVENPRFRPLMHEAIQQALREGSDEVWTNGALQLQQGWMHIHGLRNLFLTLHVDNRNIPALGRIGDPDDIIASVLVEDSRILPDTYQAMPSYRLCTSDGPTQLTEGLAKRLKDLLEDVASRETP
ncbi:hypothetical protein HYDPIDRAFT_91999 [Hydnomerulius pinastri MD-312]|uniref:Uncharacterized protein n=1 Tax=Hydnomerulius pinastri MD-312 TaxID=994086 RepID=A0A0C9VZ32_9AGAM|nr:hypothetical protein HYDPIDRAFT_91999 [Hydnomerulius pinastri MD-312]